MKVILGLLLARWDFPLKYGEVLYRRGFARLSPRKKKEADNADT
jgi:hypothetical protein